MKKVNVVCISVVLFSMIEVNILLFKYIIQINRNYLFQLLSKQSIAFSISCNLYLSES